MGYLQKLFKCLFTNIFSNLNNFFINQKICVNSIIRKNLLIPKFFSWLNPKKYAYYLITKNFVSKQKYLVYFLECRRTKRIGRHGLSSETLPKIKCYFLHRKKNFATNVNGLPVLKLFQLSNDDYFFFFSYHTCNDFTLLAQF